MARAAASEVRQAWDCDCGGERRAPVRRAALSGLGASVERMRSGIVRMLGEPPTSCPWRAYGDPVVAQALVLRRHWQNGAVDVDQQLAVVLEAMLAIDGAQNHVEALDMRAERERREAERRMADASRKE
jgi:hypothetical protein